MSIRAYRKPLYNPYSDFGRPAPEGMPRMEYMDVFVILEDPLLELGHADLVFLRELRIDPFTEPPSQR